MVALPCFKRASGSFFLLRLRRALALRFLLFLLSRVSGRADIGGDEERLRFPSGKAEAGRVVMGGGRDERGLAVDCSAGARVAVCLDRLERRDRLAFLFEGITSGGEVKDTEGLREVAGDGATEDSGEGVREGSGDEKGE